MSENRQIETIATNDDAGHRQTEATETVHESNRGLDPHQMRPTVGALRLVGTTGIQSIPQTEPVDLDYSSSQDSDRTVATGFGYAADDEGNDEMSSFGSSQTLSSSQASQDTLVNSTVSGYTASGHNLPNNEISQGFEEPAPGYELGSYSQPSSQASITSASSNSGEDIGTRTIYSDWSSSQGSQGTNSDRTSDDDTISEPSSQLRSESFDDDAQSFAFGSQSDFLARDMTDEGSFDEAAISGGETDWFPSSQHSVNDTVNGLDALDYWPSNSQSSATYGDQSEVTTPRQVYRQLGLAFEDDFNPGFSQDPSADIEEDPFAYQGDPAQRTLPYSYEAISFSQSSQDSTTFSDGPSVSQEVCEMAASDSDVQKAIRGRERLVLAGGSALVSSLIGKACDAEMY